MVVVLIQPDTLGLSLRLTACSPAKGLGKEVVVATACVAHGSRRILR